MERAFEIMWPSWWTWRDNLKWFDEPPERKHVYYKPQAGDPYWCEVHNRQADWASIHPDGRFQRRCDPKLGGITMPCRVVRDYGSHLRFK